MSVTIHAVPVEGGEPSTIVIDQTGPDTGTINVDGTAYQVYDVRADSDGKKLVCKTDHSIFIATITLTVTVQVMATDAHGATVRTSIEGGPVNQTKDYRITLVDETAFTHFIADAHFPVLA